MRKTKFVWIGNEQNSVKFPQVKTVFPVTDKRAENTTDQTIVAWPPNECDHIQNKFRTSSGHVKPLNILKHLTTKWVQSLL